LSIHRQNVLLDDMLDVRVGEGAISFHVCAQVGGWGGGKGAGRGKMGSFWSGRNILCALNVDPE
jgi:hypothetical protein